jgi:penicillin-binding protein 1C
MKFYRVLKILLGFTMLILSATLFAFCLDAAYPPKLDKYWDQSLVLLDRQGELLSIHLARDERVRLPIKLSDVDPLLIRLLIAYEDKRFGFHPGVDPCALIRALGQYCYHGRIISGGSTLTMQVAKLLEPRPRTLRNKCIELLRALQLECHFSKKQILEIYLGLAPYGGNLEGVSAASLSYFGKEPKYLNPAEAALLAVIPQSPTRLRPDIAQEKSKQFRDRLIDRMIENDILTAKEGSAAKQETIPTKRIAFPKLALHLHLLDKHASQDLSSQRNVVLQTTLDKNLQAQLEHYLKSILPFLEPTQNAAAVVVDNKTRQILAYLGSADFFSEKRLGQIDMVKAIRSPGSTLKPFIYGLGFDQKLLHPETLVQDVPMGFAGYAPSNFRDIFHGEVTIREALQQSLNIPAVLALDKIGPGCFCDWLNGVGVELKLKDKTSKPTLPIALGGVGLRLIDLMSLYTALGNQGEYASLQLLKTDIPENTKISSTTPGMNTNSVINSTHVMNSTLTNALKTKTQLLTRESAWHITKILQGTHAPTGFVDHELIAQSPIAYKTGTSYGYRDAWAMGYSADFTIGVWVGKADGTPSLNQTGRNTAAPILFKIMRLLSSSQQRQWPSEPPPGILSLKGSELPRSLRALQKEDANLSLTKDKAFQIQFPKDGAIIHLDKTKPLHFMLSGGKPPYYLLINGQPLGDCFMKSHIAWQPETIGFVEFSILDSRGQSDTIAVEFK